MECGVGTRLTGQVVFTIEGTDGNTTTDGFDDETLMESIRRSHALPVEKCRQLHLEVIPLHVANSMAMAGKPVY